MELEEELDQVKHGKSETLKPPVVEEDDLEDRPVQGPLPR